jgi:hypothetical protein
MKWSNLSSMAHDVEYHDSGSDVLLLKPRVPADSDDLAQQPGLRRRNLSSRLAQIPSLPVLPPSTSSEWHYGAAIDQANVVSCNGRIGHSVTAGTVV